MNAIIGKVTPLMISQIAYGTFFFYAACCFVAGVIVYVFLPETMGRTLEEMTEVSLLSCKNRKYIVFLKKIILVYIDFCEWKCICSWKKRKAFDSYGCLCQRGSLDR